MKDEEKSARLLAIALSKLPLHAEEGLQREILTESALIDALIEECGASHEAAFSLVYVVRRQFEALALLDLFELRLGRWAFVSFPASLLARSWLTTLATPEQRLFPIDYWEQGDERSHEIKEEQRYLLNRLESNRIKFNPQATAIRMVHVAWAIIRMDGKFLLHHREDKKRFGEKSYVLPGGRFSLVDLPVDVRVREGVHRDVFNADSVLVAKYINNTLERELEEETGLLPVIHYEYAPFDVSVPFYREVNGAGNRHAYTCYVFNLFQIRLTQAGETLLFDKVFSFPSKLTWFTISDIVSPQRSDGAVAYVDALRLAWDGGLEQWLANTPDSCATSRPYYSESDMLDLPWHCNGSFCVGKPGKEKKVAPSVNLNMVEWQLLVLLGWHVRGFSMDDLKGIYLLPSGWVEISSIISTVKNLQNKIERVFPRLIEIREDKYVSLRILPEILFFPIDLFRYKVVGSNREGGVFRLEREGVQTPWAFLQPEVYEKNITGKTATSLRLLEKGEDPGGDWERNFREQFGDGVKRIGLRRLWSNKGKISCLVGGLRKFSE